MDNLGELNKVNEHYELRFDLFFSQDSKDLFSILTNPHHFSQWYPFATGKMDIQLGGKIDFDDGAGSTYQGTITELEPPFEFGFTEGENRIHLSLNEVENGCRLTFTHAFDDDSWVVPTAAGWHRCLDALGQIIEELPVEWPDNTERLRKIYSEALNRTDP